MPNLTEGSGEFPAISELRRFSPPRQPLIFLGGLYILGGAGGDSSPADFVMPTPPPDAIRAAAKSLHRLYDNDVHALRPQCRKVCIVADIIRELAAKAQPSACSPFDSALQVMGDTLVDFERSLLVCATRPVRTKLLSRHFVAQLRRATQRVRDAVASLIGVVSDTDLNDALEELDEIILAFATFRDSSGKDLKRMISCGDGIALSSRLHRDGLCKDESDARAQLHALQSECTSIIASSEKSPVLASGLAAESQLVDHDVELLRGLRDLSISAAAAAATSRETPQMPVSPSARRLSQACVPETDPKLQPLTEPHEQEEQCGPAVPEHFKCPITLEMMEDPVFLFTQSGRSFERAALEQWLAYHPTVDPLTNEMHATLLEFAPNRVLREAIVTWCREKGLPEPHAPSCLCPPKLASSIARDRHDGTPTHSATLPDAIRRSPSQMAVELERLCREYPYTGAHIHRLAPEFTDADREAAARALVRECEEAEEEEAVTLEIRHAGGISALVLLLSSSRGATLLQEAAALALWKVSRRPRENRVVIANARAIPLLVRTLSSPRATILAKQAAAGILQNLSCYSSNYKVAIANAGAIRPLVRLISLDSSAGHEVDGVREDAARCLWSIAVNEQKKVAIANAGAIAPLVKLVAEGANDGVREAGAGALQNLAANNSDNKAAIVAAGAIEPLVRLVTEGITDGAKEAASGALQNLAKYNEANKAAIVRAGAIAPLAAVIGDPARSDKAKRTAARALENLAWNNDANKAVIANSSAVVALVRLLQQANAAADAREAAGESLKVLARSRHARTKIAKALGWRFLITPSEADVIELIASYVRSS